MDYNVTYKVLNASDFEVPQDRRRIFIIGYKSPITKFTFPKENNKKFLLKKLLMIYQN